MRTPPVLLIIAAAFFAYAAFNIWAMVRYASPLFLLWSAPCLAAAFGLVFRRAWSRYLVYVVCICLLAGWSTYLVMAWAHLGQEGFARLSALGFALFAFCAWSSFVVWRFFRQNRSEASAVDEVVR
jgi:hypothetical protein